MDSQSLLYIRITYRALINHLSIGHTPGWLNKNPWRSIPDLNNVTTPQGIPVHTDLRSELTHARHKAHKLNTKKASAEPHKCSKGMVKS